jgi:biotin transport system substrate-specific component
LIAGTPKTTKSAIVRISLACLAGFVVIYVPGIWRLRQVLDCSWEKAIAAGCIPFLIGDFFKAVVAIICSIKLRKYATRIFEA